MTKATPPMPVMFFAGMITADPSLFEAAAAPLVELLGPPGPVSETMDFDFTDYYENESGTNLKRWFISFENPADPEKLVSLKIFTNALEVKLAEGASVPRPINIDPGYITQAKVVLASAKDFSHRIYLRDGIYAEVTLNWRKEGWRKHPWTYPDFQSAEYHKYLTELRTRLCRKLAELKKR